MLLSVTILPLNRCLSLLQTLSLSLGLLTPAHSWKSLMERKVPRRKGFRRVKIQERQGMRSHREEERGRPGRRGASQTPLTDRVLPVRRTPARLYGWNSDGVAPASTGRRMPQARTKRMLGLRPKIGEWPGRADRLHL